MACISASERLDRTANMSVLVSGCNWSFLAEPMAGASPVESTFEGVDDEAACPVGGAGWDGPAFVQVRERRDPGRDRVRPHPA